MIKKFEPGQNYYLPGWYVTASEVVAIRWEQGVEPNPLALIPADLKDAKDYVRPYPIWAYHPSKEPEVNEFGPVSP